MVRCSHWRGSGHRQVRMHRTLLNDSDLKGLTMPLRPIPFARLVDLVEGRLAPEAEAQLRAQIVDDERAKADVSWLMRVVGAMRQSAVWEEEPSKEVVARA